MRRWVCVIVLTAGMVGCASRKRPFNEWFASEKYEDYVPKTAQVVAQGRGVLKYRASERGTLYVVDTSDMVQIKETTVPHLLGSGFVLKGTAVTFDPSTGEVKSNGEEDFKIENVKPNHSHELLFDPVKRAEEE